MKFNVLICLLFIILFIPSVQADFINGGFETGDWTGWQPYAFSAGTYWIGTPGYEGTYYAHLRSDNTQQSQVYQDIDLTGVNFIYFYYKASLGGTRYVTFDGANTVYLSDNISSWTLQKINVSAETGVTRVLFYVCCGSGWEHFYIDSVSTTEPTYSLSGYVTSSEGSGSISAATITLNNSGGSTTSNDTGYYEITNITAGTYTITATSPTHEDYSDTLSITSDTEKNITMTRLLPLLTWTDKETTQNDVYLKWRRNMVVDSIRIFKDADGNLHTTAAAGSYLTGLYKDSNLACDKGIVYWLQPMDGSTAGSKYRIDAKTLPCDGGGGSVVPDPTPGPTLPPPGPTPPPYTNITPEEWLNMTLEDKQELLINLTAELPPIIPGAWLELTWGDLWRWLLFLLILLCAAVSIDSVTTQKMTKHTGIIMVVPGVYFASLAGYFII